jgi:nitrogen fixation protein NifQ
MLANLPEKMLHAQPGSGLGPTALLGFARAPADPATLAFAGLIGRIGGDDATPKLQIPGLDEAEAHALADRYFPGAAAVFGCAGAPWPGDASETEFDDLLTLLLAHGAADMETRWVALAVANACMGDNHLWQNLGLPGRNVLSMLLTGYFPTLAEKNVNDMKWKKFFYKQFCERAEVFVCKAPSCGVCTDYAKCFGPEETREES